MAFVFLVAFLVLGALSTMLAAYLSSVYLSSFQRRSRVSRSLIFCIALLVYITIFASCVAFAAIVGEPAFPSLSGNEFVDAIINGGYVWGMLFLCLVFAVIVFRVVAGLVHLISQFLSRNSKPALLQQSPS